MGRGDFKTMPDGTKLFFPWAAGGAGYVIASEEDHQRLRQQIKLYNMAYLAVAMVVAVAVEWFTKISSIAVVIIAGFLGELIYKAWMRRLLPRLKASDEKLSYREWWSGRLKALKPIGPWTVQEPSVTSPRAVSE